MSRLRASCSWQCCSRFMYNCPHMPHLRASCSWQCCSRFMYNCPTCPTSEHHAVGSAAVDSCVIVPHVPASEHHAVGSAAVDSCIIVPHVPPRWPSGKASASSSNPACAGIFSGSSHTSNLKIVTPVATLPGAWRYRVSAGIGRPGVSIPCLGEVESSICNFNLSVAARKIV